MAFLVYRISALDMITRHQAEYLWKKLSALGWRTREPEDTEFPPETPSVFPALVRMHSEQLGYDMIGLERLLNIDTSDIRRMYGSFLTKNRLYAVT